jgi:hypothetical protein
MDVTAMRCPYCVAPTLDRGSCGQIVEPGGSPFSDVFTLNER